MERPRNQVSSLGKKVGKTKTKLGKGSEEGLLNNIGDLSCKTKRDQNRNHDICEFSHT
jgi:hypothetical protein